MTVDIVKGVQANEIYSEKMHVKIELYETI